MIKDTNKRIIVTISKEHYDIVKEYCDLKGYTMSQYIDRHLGYDCDWLPNLIKKAKKELVNK